MNTIAHTHTQDGSVLATVRVDGPPGPCLADSDSIGKECGRSIEWPIRHFDIRRMGVDLEEFVRSVGPSYGELPWDRYDSRRGQLGFLGSCFPDQKGRIEEIFSKFYRGAISLEAVQDLVERLDPPQRSEFERILPFRRRAIVELRLENTGIDQWTIERRSVEGFTQDVGQSDFRFQERVFEDCAPAFYKSAQLHLLAARLAQLIQEDRPALRELRMVTHQVSIVARPGAPASNSPEGIHQDGFDYIVSALVLERTNISGGASNIFGPDKETVYFHTELQPGEGILQRDRGTTLWHNVTPVEVIDGSDGALGVRNIIGVDIELLGDAALR